MQRHALKLAVGTAAVAAALMYLGASGEARQAPQTGGGGRGEGSVLGGFGAGGLLGGLLGGDNDE